MFIAVRNIHHFAALQYVSLHNADINAFISSMRF
nr:MAG TPA: hypothetical protein [Caudoviricetes sp.]